MLMSTSGWQFWVKGCRISLTNDWAVRRGLRSTNPASYLSLLSLAGLSFLGERTPARPDLPLGWEETRDPVVGHLALEWRNDRIGRFQVIARCAGMLRRGMTWTGRRFHS